MFNIGCKQVFEVLPYLPSSYTRDDENEGEGDDAEGNPDTDFLYVIQEGGSIGRVQSRPWLETKSISHTGSSSAQIAFCRKMKLFPLQTPETYL